MNRKEIKALAREKIKGNKWNIIWPVLVITFIEGIVERIFGLNTTIDFSNIEAMEAYHVDAKVTIGLAVVGIIFGIVAAGYKKYVLNFTRTGKFEINDIINCIKEKWLNLLIASILVYIIVFACTLLFVIPGIIMSIAYAMVVYLVIDSDVSGSDSLKRSREMMKGYKWDYFVFWLSFIGWILLIPLTLGIILIWLFPYMQVAEALYYDKLKEITKK